MTTYKVSELTGALLNAAVAKADGWRLAPMEDTDGQIQMMFALARPDKAFRMILHDDEPWKSPFRYDPQGEWSDGGPIIERERICIEFWKDGFDPLGYWGASLRDEHGHEVEDIDPKKGEEMASGFCPVMATGATPLLAAMRAFVASKLGDTVELE